MTSTIERKYRRETAPSPCSYPGCRERVVRKGLCAGARFDLSVDRQAEGCWLWTRARNAYGYGMFSSEELEVTLAHRASYVLHFGPIPSGLEVCHSCDTPACVNPEHLWLGTHHQNMLDMQDKGRALGRYDYKTHCKRDHPLSGDNLRPRADGKRDCWTCFRDRDRRYKAAKKAARAQVAS